MHVQTARAAARKLREDAKTARRERQATFAAWAKDADDPAAYAARWNRCENYGKRWSCDTLLSTDREWVEGLCEPCYHEAVAEARAMDAHDRFADGWIDFADPGSGSALRAENVKYLGGVAHCPGCRSHVRLADHFCRQCGRKLFQRNNPCRTCGAPDALTDEDVSLGYQCDHCAGMVERGLSPTECGDYWERIGKPMPRKIRELVYEEAAA